MPDLELLLWVLVLGGIAALGTTDRRWYVQQLRWLAAILEIYSWDHLKLTMVSILWLEIPCVFKGFNLWEEVCMLELNTVWCRFTAGALVPNLSGENPASGYKKLDWTFWAISTSLLPVFFHSLSLSLLHRYTNMDNSTRVVIWEYRVRGGAEDMTPAIIVLYQSPLE